MLNKLCKNSKLPFLHSLCRILLLVLSTACVKDEEMKLGFESYMPSLLSDSLEISSPEAEGFNVDEFRKVFETVHQDSEYQTVRSLLVLKNGKLVGETYTRTAKDRDRFNNIQSSTKSVTSLLTGIAIGEGYLQGVESKISDYLPEYFESGSAKSNITIAHCLTMTTGIDFNNSIDTEPLINNSDNSVKYVLDNDMNAEPGKMFQYHDGAPHLLAAVIQRTTGKTLEEYAKEKLFNPLGITGYQWEKHKDGTTYGAFALWLKPRDMVKLGLLCLNNGSWKGQQLIPAAWLAESTKTHVNPYGNGPYGYYWWLLPDLNAYTAIGHGGQYIMIVPERDLVVVITADPYTDPYVYQQLWKGPDLLSKVIEALVD